MKTIEFGVLGFVFINPKEDQKPETLEVWDKNGLLYKATPEQLTRMLRAFRAVSQKERI